MQNYKLWPIQRKKIHWKSFKECVFTKNYGSISDLLHRHGKYVVELPKNDELEKVLVTKFAKEFIVFGEQDIFPLWDFIYQKNTLYINNSSCTQANNKAIEYSPNYVINEKEATNILLYFISNMPSNDKKVELKKLQDKPINLVPLMGNKLGVFGTNIKYYLWNEAHFQILPHPSYFLSEEFTKNRNVAALRLPYFTSMTVEHILSKHLEEILPRKFKGFDVVTNCNAEELSLLDRFAKFCEKADCLDHLKEWAVIINESPAGNKVVSPGYLKNMIYFNPKQIISNITTWKMALQLLGLDYLQNEKWKGATTQALTATKEHFLYLMKHKINQFGRNQLQWIFSTTENEKKNQLREFLHSIGGLNECKEYPLFKLTSGSYGDIVNKCFLPRNVPYIIRSDSFIHDDNRKYNILPLQELSMRDYLSSIFINDNDLYKQLNDAEYNGVIMKLFQHLNYVDPTRINHTNDDVELFKKIQDTKIIRIVNNNNNKREDRYALVSELFDAANRLFSLFFSQDDATRGKLIDKKWTDWNKQLLVRLGLNTDLSIRNIQVLVDYLLQLNGKELARRILLTNELLKYLFTNQHFNLFSTFVNNEILYDSNPLLPRFMKSQKFSNPNQIPLCRSQLPVLHEVISLFFPFIITYYIVLTLYLILPQLLLFFHNRISSDCLYIIHNFSTIFLI